MDSGRKFFLRLLAVAFLMLGFVSDGTGGGVILPPCDPNDPSPPPCCKQVVTFAGWPFSGILIGEQENGGSVIRVTMFITSIPLLPSEAAVTQLFRLDVGRLPMGKTLDDLTEEELQGLVIGDPSTAPPTGLCFNSLSGDPLFFLTTGAIRVRKLVGITPPPDKHPLVLGTTAFRWAQVFGFVIPEGFLADPLIPGTR
jgi:hypothetical protein